MSHEYIIEYGMSPELAGRIPAIATLNELTVSDFVSIMTTMPNYPTARFIQELASISHINQLSYIPLECSAICKQGIVKLFTVVYTKL